MLTICIYVCINKQRKWSYQLESRYGIGLKKGRWEGLKEEKEGGKSDIYSKFRKIQCEKQDYI